MSGSGMFQIGRGGYNHGGSGLWINAKRLVAAVPNNQMFQTLRLLKKEGVVPKEKMDKKIEDAAIKGLISYGDFAVLVS